MGNVGDEGKSASMENDSLLFWCADEIIILKKTPDGEMSEATGWLWSWELWKNRCGGEQWAKMEDVLNMALPSNVFHVIPAGVRRRGI